MSRRVLQIIDGLNVGGAEVLLRDLAAGLRDRGWEVSVAYSTPGPLAAELEQRGLPLFRLPRLARVDPLLLLRVWALIRRLRPDVVHTHLFKSDFHGRPAARLAGVPAVISTLHNSDAWARQPVLGAVYGWNARLADRLIAVSDEVRAYHQSHSRLSPDRLVTIENAVDAERFAGQTAAGQAVRAELGLRPEQVVFGVIGRLKPQKDQANFLRAAAAMRAQTPEARFLIIGDGPLRAELEAESRALGLEAVVAFLGLRADIPAVLGALDVLVLSSRWEGLPVTLLEGMAAGRPVAATAVDGVRGVALPDETALLVPPQDPAALAEACQALYADPALRQRLGAAGQARVRARYSLTAMIDRTAGLYEDVLAERGRAR